MSKIGKNTPCSCGSGLKYKKCCMNKSKEMKNPILQLLKDETFRNIYNTTRDKGFHTQSVINIPESWAKLTQEERCIREEYISICSAEEVERIILPSNTSDVLLKLRADSILGNMRIRRTFFNRA